MECYCYQEFKEIGFAIREVNFGLKAKEKAPCSEWLQYYSLSVVVLLGISVGIAILNAILRVFLRESTNIEGKHTTT